MSELAIRTDGLGKRYRIGAQEAPYRTLRESLTDAATAPVRRIRAVLRGEASIATSDTIWALRDVSIDVKRGEVVGVIGPNGAGKTTLLKILSRITKPTKGEVDLWGRVGSLLEIGTGFHPELTGRENIYLNSSILGMSRSDIERKFDEIVAFAEIEKFLDTPVKHYSSGMYVRLAFAVAAHLEPDILLVDEVLAVGDIEFQKKSLGKMADVARQGQTVLFVSHNMAAIQELCPRALLIVDGSVIADGASPEVISDYLSAHSDKSEGAVDVSDPLLRRNSLVDSKFRWTRIELINSDGQATALLELAEPFELMLQGIADADISRVRVGFAITSTLGVPVFNSFQIDNGLPDRMAAGDIRYRVHLDPNLLAPGTYEISLGANGAGVTDWLPSALQFTVATVGSYDIEVWGSYRGGLVRYPCRWEGG